MFCSRFHIVILGSGGVGKTCILQRYIYGTFSEEYVETVEELYTQPYTINGRQQNIDFIDTAGNISFPAMRRIYISKAQGFILVYSISDKQSYKEMQQLWEDIKMTRSNILSIPVVVIGNNLDEENLRQVETFDALDWACCEDLGGCFLEVSAKQNKNINNIFRLLFEQFGNTRSKQKGSHRLRSTSICRMLSESDVPQTNQTKKKLLSRSKTVACNLSDELTFQDMVFDNYKETTIEKLQLQKGTFSTDKKKRNNVVAMFSGRDRRERIIKKIEMSTELQSKNSISLNDQDINDQATILTSGMKYSQRLNRPKSMECIIA